MIYHDLKIKNTANPIKQHPYRLNPVKQKYLKQEINYLLANNFIEPSNSNWSSRSKSSSGKNLSSKDTNTDMISLSAVKELLNVQESSIKSFMSVYMDNTSQRLDGIMHLSSETPTTPTPGKHGVYMGVIGD